MCLPVWNRLFQVSLPGLPSCHPNPFKLCAIVKNRQKVVKLFFFLLCLCTLPPSAFSPSDHFYPPCLWLLCQCMKYITDTRQEHSTNHLTPRKKTCAFKKKRLTFCLIKKDFRCKIILVWENISVFPENKNSFLTQLAEFFWLIKENLPVGKEFLTHFEGACFCSEQYKTTERRKSGRLPCWLPSDGECSRPLQCSPRHLVWLLIWADVSALQLSNHSPGVNEEPSCIWLHVNPQSDT